MNYGVLVKVFLSSFTFIFWLLLPSGFAQDLAKDGIVTPPAPEGYIMDDTGFFRDHPEKRQEISDALQRLSKNYDYPVYLVIYYSVFEGTLQNKADELYRSWMGESGPGMVIVYQRDPVSEGSNPAIAYYQGSGLKVKPVHSDLPKNLIPRRDVESMLANVFSELKSPKDDTSSYLASIIVGIESELASYFSMAPPNWNDSSNLRMMAIFAGSVALLGLLGMLFWRLFTRADTRAAKVYYFPDVKTGRRLGAPYGGGWTSERSFGSSSSRG
jgi:hypothetical protein